MHAAPPPLPADGAAGRWERLVARRAAHRLVLRDAAVPTTRPRGARVRRESARGRQSNAGGSASIRSRAASP